MINYATTKQAWPSIIIYDIPRTQLEYVNYDALEKLKNGMAMSGKYEGGMILMPHPHVVVFANQPPDESKLSSDRWFIHEIGGLDMMPCPPPMPDVTILDY